MKGVRTSVAFLIALGLVSCIAASVLADDLDGLAPDIAEKVAGLASDDWEVRYDALASMLDRHEITPPDRSTWFLRKEYDCERIRAALIELLAREVELSPVTSIPGEGYADYHSALGSVAADLRDPRSLPYLLRRPFRNINRAVIRAIGEMGGKEVFDELLAELRKPRHTGTADWAMEVLEAMLGNERAHYSPSEEERRAVVEAVDGLLTRYGQPSVTDEWYETKKIAYSGARKGCVRVLGKIGDPGSRKILERIAASDPDSREQADSQGNRIIVHPVREAAKQVLKELEARDKQEE